MDKVIEKKKWTVKKIIVLFILPIVFVVLVLSWIFADHSSTIKLEADKLVISTVSYDDFQEYISVLGSVRHKENRFIDAIQPGIIKRVNIESGANVKAGDVILELSNSSLELNVITQESAIYYQLSTIRNSKLQLNQNNLNQISQLANYNYQLNLSEPQYQRYKILLEKKLVSQWEFDQVNEQYLMYKKQKEIFLSTYYSDSISRVSQLEQISMSENRMIESLSSIRNMLDELIVRAPIDGQLSTPQYKIGQTINQGARIGQVDVLGNYVIQVNIDEHYLPEISLGKKGTFEFAGSNYELVISKITLLLLITIFN